MAISESEIVPKIKDVRSKISRIPTSFRNDSDANKAIRDAKDALTDLTLVVERLAERVLTGK